MSNQVSLTANPQTQPSVSSGVASHITATVVKCANHQPVVNELVVFSTTAPWVTFSTTSAKTDRHGRASTTISYPVPGAPCRSGGGTIPIAAKIQGAAAHLDVIIYSPHLLPFRITNLAPGNIINDRAIAAGIQVIVPQPLTGKIGDIFTFHWGNHSVQRAYDGTNFPWVIDLSAVFDPDVIYKNGKYLIYYAEMDGAGNESDAAPLDLMVKRAPSSPCLQSDDFPAEEIN